MVWRAQSCPKSINVTIWHHGSSRGRTACSICIKWPQPDTSRPFDVIGSLIEARSHECHFNACKANPWLMHEARWDWKKSTEIIQGYEGSSLVLSRQYHTTNGGVVWRRWSWFSWDDKVHDWIINKGERIACHVDDQKAKSFCAVVRRARINYNVVLKKECNSAA